MTSMEQLDVKTMRDNTLKELERLVAQRKEIDKKAAALRTTLNGLNALLEAEAEKYTFRLDLLPLPPGYDGLRDMGLTDAIRKLFENEPEKLTPKDVREKLESLEYKRIPRSNPLAAIHGIFTRLEKAGEITPIKDAKNAYQWVNPAQQRFPIRQITRARTAPGSFAAQQFAKEDAKKGKKG